MRKNAKIDKTQRELPGSVKRRAFRLREIEAEIGVPVSTLRTMVRSGKLNPITSFGPWLIAAEEYEGLLNKRLRN